MAVTRADKDAELEQLESGVQGIGQRDPGRLQGDERPAGHRAAAAAPRREGELQGRQEHARASARSRARSFEALEKYFEGTTAVAYTDDRSGGARQDADDVRQDGADADRSRRRSCRGARSSRRRSPSSRRCRASRSCTRKLLGRAAGADGAARQRAERRAARSDERAGGGGKEATGSVDGFGFRLRLMSSSLKSVA